MSANVVIPPREAAEQAARAATAQTKAPTDALTLHVFCDGSYKRGHQPKANPSNRRSFPRRDKSRGGIGIVVDAWPPRSTTNQRLSRAFHIPYIENSDDINTIEAFALAEGTHIALDLIADFEKRSAIRLTDSIEITFWTDSQKALQALQDPKWMLLHPGKMQHVIDIIKLKTHTLQGLRGNVSVQFRWCPGECVEPHKTADELSKRIRVSGGGAPSKAVVLFIRVPHSSIKSELRKWYNWADKSKADKTIENSIPSLPDASQSKPDESMGTSKQPPQDTNESKADEIIEPSSSNLPDASQSRLDEMMEPPILSPPDAMGSIPDEIMETSTPGPSNAIEIKQEEPIETSISELPDPYALIQAAALQLPIRQGEVMLAAIELQKMINASRAQDEAENRVQHREDQEYESAGQGNEHEGLNNSEGLDERQGRPVRHVGQGRGQDGFSNEAEHQFHQAREGEPRDNEDGDVQDELGIFGDREAHPTRMRGLLNWVRGLRQL